MHKALLRLGGAAALVALTATNAHAIGFPYSNSNVCGGNKFQTCASLSIDFSASTATNSIVNITIQNLGPGVFSSFGFSHLPAGVTYTGTVDAALGSRFTVGVQNDIQADGFGAVPQGGGIPHNSLQVGEGPFTFTMTFSRVLTPTELAALDFDIHAQAGPNGCSTKLEIAPDGSTSTTLDPNCGSTTVPEPMTMSLLATGLAGMGGLGAFKRRRVAK
jgi:hypothetical protein